MAVLYLDMNVYNRPFDDQSQMRIRLETTAITMLFAAIEKNTLSARWSFVLEYENSRNPFSERRSFVQFLARACSETIQPSPGIEDLAERLENPHHVRGRDAIHLACAEQSHCDYLVTCDDRLIRQGERLREAGVLTVRVINPIDLLREV